MITLIPILALLIAVVMIPTALTTRVVLPMWRAVGRALRARAEAKLVELHRNALVDDQRTHDTYAMLATALSYAFGQHGDLGFVFDTSNGTLKTDRTGRLETFYVPMGNVGRILDKLAFHTFPDPHDRAAFYSLPPPPTITVGAMTSAHHRLRWAQVAKILYDGNPPADNGTPL